MKDWVFLSVLALLVALFMLNVHREEKRIEGFVIRFAEDVRERDRRMFALNNRLQTLEEQRDIERRVTELEKAIRTFCVGSKTEMCGSLRTTR